MDGPTFFELVWDRRHGFYVRPTEDRIDPGDLPDALDQLQACREIAGNLPPAIETEAAL